MKVAVTGHTSGIGSALADECRKRGYEVVGFSRSNGYDISDPATQDRIVDEINDCDLFINNAHDGFSQTEIFTKVFRRWKLEKKIIANVGSIVTSFRSGPVSPQHPQGRAHYAAEKSGLEMASNWAWNDFESRCEVVLLRPGLVDTPRTRIGSQPGSTKINANDMAKFILSSILDQSFVVREITINPRK